MTGTSSSSRPSGGTATRPSRPKNWPPACSPLQKNRFEPGEDYRTPWQRNADHELVEYELGQYRKIRREPAKALGLM